MRGSSDIDILREMRKMTTWLSDNVSDDSFCKIDEAIDAATSDVWKADASWKSNN